MVRSGDATPTTAARDGLAAPDKKTLQAVTASLQDILIAPPSGKRFTVMRDTVWLTPDIPVPSRGIFAPGVCIGTLQKGRLVPHHQLFSAYGTRFRARLSLQNGDPRVAAYLRGEEIAAPELAGKSGFAALLYEGAPLGGGKAVDGRLKNHYPKGLRNRA
jgi:NOL1/NOP2/fmu family ribosome biogenesis protein